MHLIAVLIFFQVTLQMMRERNEEFEAKMNSVERASKELRLIRILYTSFVNQIDSKIRYGAQLELMYYFDKTEARCYFLSLCF